MLQRLEGWPGKVGSDFWVECAQAFREENMEVQRTNMEGENDRSSVGTGIEG